MRMETEKNSQCTKNKSKDISILSKPCLIRKGRYFTIRLHSWFMFANNHIGYDCFVGVAQSLSAELSKSYQPGIVEMFLITLHSIFYLSTL